MLRHFFFTYLAIASFSFYFGGPIKAAEVGCDTIYQGSAHRSEDVDRKLWPAGFRPVPGMCMNGFLRGTIERGDFDKVRALFAKNHPLITTFFVVSPGGDVDEALKIGALFRKYLVYAWAPMRFPEGGFYLPLTERAKCENQSMQNCSCVSACALIWFGAPKRFGIVGLHRPRTTDPAFKSLLPGEAAKAYKQKLDAIVHYLNEMEVPKQMIDAMVATSSADVRWADVHDEGLERAPSFAEWVSASCGQISSDERKSKLQLEKRKATLTPNEALLLKMLVDKDRSYNSCETYLIASSRERLGRPE